MPACATCHTELRDGQTACFRCGHVRAAVVPSGDALLEIVDAFLVAEGEAPIDRARLRAEHAQWLAGRKAVAKAATPAPGPLTRVE